MVIEKPAGKDINFYTAGGLNSESVGVIDLAKLHQEKQQGKGSVLKPSAGEKYEDKKTTKTSTETAVTTVSETGKGDESKNKLKDKPKELRSELESIIEELNLKNDSDETLFWKDLQKDLIEQYLNESVEKKSLKKGKNQNLEILKAIQKNRNEVINIIKKLKGITVDIDLVNDDKFTVDQLNYFNKKISVEDINLVSNYLGEDKINNLKNKSPEVLVSFLIEASKEIKKQKEPEDMLEHIDLISLLRNDTIKKRDTLVNKSKSKGVIAIGDVERKRFISLKNASSKYIDNNFKDINLSKIKLTDIEKTTRPGRFIQYLIKAKEKNIITKDSYNARLKMFTITEANNIKKIIMENNPKDTTLDNMMKILNDANYADLDKSDVETIMKNIDDFKSADYQSLEQDIITYHETMGTVDFEESFGINLADWRERFNSSLTVDLPESNASFGTMGVESFAKNDTELKEYNKQTPVTDLNIKDSSVWEKFADSDWKEELSQIPGIGDEDSIQLLSMFRSGKYTENNLDKKADGTKRADSDKKAISEIYQNYKSSVSTHERKTLDDTNNVVNEEGINYALGFIKSQLDITSVNAEGEQDQFITDLELDGKPDLQKRANSDRIIDLKANVGGNPVALQFNRTTGKLSMPQGIYRTPGNSIEISDSDSFVELPFVQGPTIENYKTSVQGINYKELIKRSSNDKYKENLRKEIDNNIKPVSDYVDLQSSVELQVQRNRVVDDFKKLIGLEGDLTAEKGKNTDMYKMFSSLHNTVTSSSLTELANFKSSLNKVKELVPTYLNETPNYVGSMSNPNNMMKYYFNKEQGLDFNTTDDSVEKNNFSKFFGIFTVPLHGNSDVENTGFSIDNLSAFMDNLSTSDNSISVNSVSADIEHDKNSNLGMFGGIYGPKIKEHYFAEVENISNGVRKQKESISKKQENNDVAAMEEKRESWPPTVPTTEDHLKNHLIG